MAELRFIVEHQRLAPARDCDFCVAARSSRYLHASFDFLTDDWGAAAQGRAMVVRRPELGLSDTVPLDALNTALVPDRMLATEGIMLVSVYGGSDPFITTTEQRVRIREAGYKD